MAEDARMCNGGGRHLWSACALDGDERLANPTPTGGVRSRNGARDFLTIDPAERRRMAEVARFAIGGSDRHAAAVAGRQAAIDAVAIGIIGDDENALLGLRADIAAKEDGKGEGGEKTAHGLARWSFYGFLQIRRMRGKLLSVG